MVAVRGRHRVFAAQQQAPHGHFRVDDLKATLTGLREEGCRVLGRFDDGEQGKFGYVLDPEGGLIELWQPNPNHPAVADGE